MKYIYQYKDWPNVTWDGEVLLELLSKVRNFQGRLVGKMESLGFDLREQAVLETLTLDVLKSSEIEGENLNRDEVRSSVARRMGMDFAGMVTSSRDVEGVVDMMLDATQNHDKELTEDRLLAWHSSLFPSGQSGMYKITVGDWRKDGNGPVQVVSGPMNRERVHFEAPAAELVPAAMKEFVEWFNSSKNSEPLIKAAVMHLWFLTVHPFDDGNGRIGRALIDMQLARADQSKQRFYSMSDQIERNKKEYYRMLERTQKDDLDITEWIEWFLNTLYEALERTSENLHKVLGKAKFWELHRDTVLNDRQKFMLNKLLGDFFGKLQTSKWAKMTKTTKLTAHRDIKDLVEKGVLYQEEGGGRSTSYALNLPDLKSK